MQNIYVVGLGPGTDRMITPEAHEILNKVDTIIGYTVYLELIRDRYPDKEYVSTPMKQEMERCELCYQEALQGKQVAMVCSGDPGVYGMASIMLELYAKNPEYERETNVIIIPGITAAVSGAALLGAPINHDFCVISLSDLLTPWDLIEKRLRAAAEGDFCISIYNPSSKKRKDHLRRACEILLENIEGDRPCGYVRNIGREGETCAICTLEELKDKEVDMFTTVFIGNSKTYFHGDKLITPRGYNFE